MRLLFLLHGKSGDNMPRPKGSKNKTPAQGRKTIFKSVTIVGSPEEVEKLKELAEKSGKSVSRFIIETILN